MAKASTAKKRKRKQGANELESLLNALTIDSKRQALATLGGSRTGGRINTSEAVDAAIQDCGKSVAQILRTLRQIEIDTPKKHFYFGTAVGDVAAALATASTRLGKEVVEHVKLTYAQEHRDVASFLFERITDGWESVPLPDRDGLVGIKGNRRVKIRHACVVRVDLQTKRAMLTYEGLPIGVDYDYTAIIDAALKSVAELGVNLDPLPVRACVKPILRAKGRRILPVRGDIEIEMGVVGLRSHKGMATIQQLIARLVDSESAEEPALLDKITDTLGDAAFHRIGLLWADERVFTRIEFLPPGPDFLFVWGGNDPSYSLVGRLTEILYELAEVVQSPTFEEIWTAIVGLPKDHLVLPGDFRSRFSATRAEVDKALVEALKLGLLVPVYQLRADPDWLEEWGLAGWTEDPTPLARTFTASSGDRLDGRQPENVSVAFRRAASRGVK